MEGGKEMERKRKRERDGAIVQYLTTSRVYNWKGNIELLQEYVTHRHVPISGL